MSSVKLETRNEGRGLREWDYVPLSEPRVVIQQIKNRYRVDESYYPLKYEQSNPLLSNGVFPFSEPVLVTYMDLDMQIETAGLTKAERKIVDWVMEGYAIGDIAEHTGANLGRIELLISSAAKKISDKNNKNYKSRGIVSVGEEFF